MHNRMSSIASRSTRPVVSFTPQTSIEPAASVRDYDQLPPSLMAAIPDLVENGRTRVDRRIARHLEQGEILKFTGYYRVEIEE
ncbi:MAG: hypothetical protein ABEJ58_02535 [Halodesulfurarchaeum sp.]